MNQGILDAFVTAVIAASDYEEMDRIYLKKSHHESRWRRRARPQLKRKLMRQRSAGRDRYCK